MRKRGKEQQGKSVVISIIIGMVISMLLIIIAAAVLATMFLNEAIGLNSGRIAVVVMTLLSVFLGAFIAVKASGGEKRLLIVGCSSAGLMAIVIGVNVLFFDAIFPGLWGGFVAALLGSALAFVLSGQRGKRSGRHIKIHSR